jgi:hypothetical protein
MGIEQPDRNALDTGIDRAKATEIDLPPGFTASVMRRVRAAAEGFSFLTRWSRRSAVSRFGYTTNSTGGRTVTKKVLIGTVAAAAIVFGVAYFTGYPPILSPGTEATIGAAQRYQAKQMSDKDVVLGNAAAQTFLQSETFDRLMKNDKARNFLKKASKDPDMKKALMDPQLLRLLRNHNVAELFAEDNLAELMQHPALLDAIQDAEFLAALRIESFIRLVKSPQIQAALDSSDPEAALKTPSLMRLFTEAQLQPQYRALLDAMSPDVADALTDADLMHALTDADLQGALANVELRQMIANPEIVSWLRQAQVAELFADELFVDAIQQADLLAALTADGFAPAFSASQFEAALFKQ